MTLGPKDISFLFSLKKTKKNGDGIQIGVEGKYQTKVTKVYFLHFTKEDYFNTDQKSCFEITIYYEFQEMK